MAQNNQPPFPIVQVPQDLSDSNSAAFLSNALTQNFLQLKVAGSNILPNSITKSQLSQVITDADSRIVYGPNTTTWTVQTASATAPAGYIAGYNGQYHYTATTNATVYLSILTSGFNLYAIKGPSCGQINVSVDGGTPTLVDLYSSSYGISAVYTTSFGYGSHTIKATLLGTKNASSTGYDFDFIGIGDNNELIDTNFSPGALSDISIGQLNAGKIQTGSILSSTIQVSGTLSFPQRGAIGYPNNGLKFLGDGNTSYSDSYIYPTEAPYAVILQAGNNGSQGGFGIFSTTSSGNPLEIAYFSVNNLTLYDDSYPYPKSIINFTRDASNNELISLYNGLRINNGLQDIFSITSAGLINFAKTATQTTSPSAGGAGSLPATPAGYMQIQVNGTNRWVPYY